MPEMKRDVFGNWHMAEPEETDEEFLGALKGSHHRWGPFSVMTRSLDGTNDGARQTDGPGRFLDFVYKVLFIIGTTLAGLAICIVLLWALIPATRP